MKITDRIRNFIGLGPDRSLPPPHVLAIADGVLVTERRAEAWFTITTSNTDTASAAEREAELEDVMAAVERMLGDRPLHLKIVYGRISGETYAQDVCPDPNSYGAAWTAQRAERIDELSLPERHVLLGVHLSDRAVGETADVRRRASDTITGAGQGVRRKELLHLDAQMRKLGRLLSGTPWKCRPASVETIAWMIGREQHRTITAVPHEGTISGASIARLTQGRVVPYTDHLRIHGGDGQVLAYTAVMVMSEFPDFMTFPSDGAEWLRTLGSITRVVDLSDTDADDYDDDATGSLEVPVLAEASMRWRVLSRREAQKIAEKVRASAKEQRRSAEKGSAEEAPEEVKEAEAMMRELKRELARDGLSLCEDHPRIIVTEGTLDDLRAACDAVTAHYAGLGITCEVGYDEQRELWLESLPGDSLRVPDMGHVHDSPGLFGASWWAGASVGDSNPAVPVIGYLTGSTDGLVRNSLTAGARRGDATTTLFVGISGRGKTTGLELQLLDAAAGGAWAPFLDFKGDAARGLTETAHAFGIPTGLIVADGRYAGAADLFRVLPTEDAVLHVERQLALLVPRSMRVAAEEHLLDAVTHVAENHPKPSAAAVIEHLLTGEGERRRLGEQLATIAKTPLGATVVGRPPNDEAPSFTNAPGLWVVQVPGLQFPTSENPDDWQTIERVSLACYRGFTAWVMHAMSDQALRGLDKVVGLPEAHLITNLSDGTTFLNFIARLGRALGGSLAIDTQDPKSIAGIPGLVEQIVTVFAFQQRSDEQVQAAAELLGLDASDPNVTNLIRRINRRAGGGIRHGHCLMRDHDDKVATVQLDMPSPLVQSMLDTSARAAAARHARDEAEAQVAQADEQRPATAMQEVPTA